MNRSNTGEIKYCMKYVRDLWHNDAIAELAYYGHIDTRGARAMSSPCRTCGPSEVLDSAESGAIRD